MNFVVLMCLSHIHKFLHHQLLHRLLLMYNHFQYVEQLNDHPIPIDVGYVLKLNQHHSMHDFVESILTDMKINLRIYYQMYILKLPFDRLLLLYEDLML